MSDGCALFGKVQTRRDFIAVSTTRAFLAAWEPWVQNSVAASREKLQDRWTEAFLQAPIWRFWIGADVMGTAAMGAVMPSMDGVGRYFPLTLVACAPDGDTYDPPEVNAQTAWFEKVEDFLLETLDTREHERLLEKFHALAPPPSRRKGASWPDTSFDSYDIVRVSALDRSFEKCFELSRGADPDRAFAASSFWWTLGGEGFPACALAARRMPSPFVYAGMLTGQFAEGDARDA